jgi:hypothetical protein
MNVDFIARLAGDSVLVNAQDEMAVGRAGVVGLELIASEIPVGVKPMRVPGGKEETTGAISLREFRGARRLFDGSFGRLGVAFAGAASGGWRRGCVAFQENGRDIEFFTLFGRGARCALGFASRLFCTFHFHNQELPARSPYRGKPTVPRL